jgi:hypothetical protein
MAFAGGRRVRALALALAMALAPSAPAYAQAQSESRAAQHGVEVERIVSPGGIEAWLVSDSTVPMIVLRAHWRGGSAIEPERLTGVTGVMADMLTEGAGGLDANAFKERLQDLESLRVGNIDDLDTLFDSTAYLTAQSDIVALLVLEHQVEVQNEISRLRFETVGRLAEEGGDVDIGQLGALVEPLVRAMLMVDSVPLTGTISGGSGFREHFESLGPIDAAGRSLREFDLETRLFRYPLSYLIYSEAFSALPGSVKESVYDRLKEILRAAPADDGFAMLTTSDRAAIAAVLAETLPDVFAP